MVLGYGNCRYLQDCSSHWAGVLKVDICESMQTWRIAHFWLNLCRYGPCPFQITQLSVFIDGRKLCLSLCVQKKLLLAMIRNWNWFSSLILISEITNYHIIQDRENDFYPHQIWMKQGGTWIIFFNHENSQW